MHRRNGGGKETHHDLDILLLHLDLLLLRLRTLQIRLLLEFGVQDFTSCRVEEGFDVVTSVGELRRREGRKEGEGKW